MNESESQVIVINYGDFKSVLLLILVGVIFVLAVGYDSGYMKPALIWIIAGVIFHIAYGEKYEFHEEYLAIKSLWRPTTIPYNKIIGMKNFHIRYSYILYIAGNQRIRVLHQDFIHDKLVEKAVARLSAHIEHNHRLKNDAQNARAS